MSEKAHFLTRYEREVRISLLLLVFFLFLMNFVTLFLFHNTQNYLQHEFRQKLSYLGNSIKQAFRADFSDEQLSAALRDLALGEDIWRIDIYAENGKLFCSSHPALPADTLIQRLAQLPVSGKFPHQPATGRIFYDINRQPCLDFFYPLKSTAGREEYLAVTRVNARPLVSLEKSGRITFWLLALGFISAFAIAFFLIKSTLKPYQAIKQEAFQANLVPAAAVERGTDLMVETFKRTISELKEKEKILQELYQHSNQRAENLSRLNEYILSGMQSGVIICNPGGQITKVNQAALKILKVSEHDLVGKMFFDYFGENSPLAQLVQKALLERSTTLGREIELERPNSKSLTLEVNTSLIEEEKGELLGVTVLFTDVTQLVGLRAELLAKEKMAALGEMTAGLAHQLRNSMGAIYGFANLLRKSIGEPNQLGQIVEEIGQETRTLESLVDKFLNFSKPLQLQPERIDLRQIIQESYQTLCRNKITNLPEFVFKTGETDPIIWGDKLLLKQCFQNILQNALEAMSQGGRLQVSLDQSRWREKEGILIQVTDSGLGMTDKELAKIFEPFYSTKESGIGLGLSLTRKIIQEHGGRIEARSRKGEGSTFEIFLPVEQVREPDKVIANA
jgi:PAS domain S-box-containing protein